MKRKTNVFVLTGLLVLTLAGCGNSLLGKPVSSDNSAVTSDTSPTTNDGALEEGDQNPTPNTSDVSDTAPIMGRVVSIFDDTITLLLVTKEESGGRSATNNSPTAANGADSDQNQSGVTDAPAAAENSETTYIDNTPVYTTTGETAEIKVTGDTDITLKSGELGKLIDIEARDILLIQMSGNNAISIVVENKGDKSFLNSDEKSAAVLPDIPKSLPGGADQSNLSIQCH